MDFSRTIIDGAEVTISFSVFYKTDGDVLVKYLMDTAKANGIPDSNWLYKKCFNIMQESFEALPPATEDRKYIAVVRGSYSAVYSTKGASARNNPYSGGEYSEATYRFLLIEGTTGYYSPRETYAIVSIVEIDDEIARKENLKPMPIAKKGSEIIAWLQEAKDILSEEKYYLSI